LIIPINFVKISVVLCGYRITAIISVFQTDDAGSIPATRSKKIIVSTYPRRGDFKLALANAGEIRVIREARGKGLALDKLPALVHNVDT
jgi:hypothetical protein